MDGTPLSRRRFLAVSAVSVTAIATVSLAHPERLPGMERVRPRWLDLESLGPLEGERIRLVAQDGRSLNARVLKVTDKTSTHRGITVRQYSILMRTGLRETVDGQQFRFEHQEWGSCLLHCEPVGQNDRAIHLEAIISQLDA